MRDREALRLGDSQSENKPESEFKRIQREEVRKESPDQEEKRQQIAQIWYKEEYLKWERGEHPQKEKHIAEAIKGIAEQAGKKKVEEFRMQAIKEYDETLESLKNQGKIKRIWRKSEREKFIDEYVKKQREKQVKEFLDKNKMGKEELNAEATGITRFLNEKQIFGFVDQDSVLSLLVSGAIKQEDLNEIDELVNTLNRKPEELPKSLWYSFRRKIGWRPKKDKEIEERNKQLEQAKKNAQEKLNGYKSKIEDAGKKLIKEARAKWDRMLQRAEKEVSRRQKDHLLYWASEKLPKEERHKIRPFKIEEALGKKKKEEVVSAESTEQQSVTTESLTEKAATQKTDKEKMLKNINEELKRINDELNNEDFSMSQDTLREYRKKIKGFEEDLLRMLETSKEEEQRELINIIKSSREIEREIGKLLGVRKLEEINSYLEKIKKEITSNELKQKMPLLVVDLISDAKNKIKEYEDIINSFIKNNSEMLSEEDVAALIQENYKRIKEIEDLISQEERQKQSSNN